MRTITISLFALVQAGSAFADDGRAWVGDPVNGAKLYAAECASCHAADGSGGRVGVGLRDSGRLAFVRDDQMLAMIETGKGLKRPDEHKFADKLQYLDRWDVVAFVRTLHLELGQFFPKASRYVVGKYTIDEHGVGRIEKATGSKPKELEAYVFTFFDFPGEEGALRYVPPDPILLDQLKKKNKSGYLVFVPLDTKAFAGEVGIGMDAKGTITKIVVHDSAKDAELTNKALSRFEGEGKKGQKTPFKIGGGGATKALEEGVFSAYMRAMETVTMYDREENERTWADDE